MRISKVLVALAILVSATSCGSTYNAGSKSTEKHAKKMNKQSGNPARCYKY